MTYGFFKKCFLTGAAGAALIFSGVLNADGFYLALATPSAGDLYFHEDFDLPAGDLVSSANWNSSGSGAVAVLDTDAGNGKSLAFPGLESSGRRVELSASRGQSAIRSFPAVSSGDLYYSFLLNVTALPTGTNYIAYLRTGSAYGARLFIAPSGSGFRLGVSNTAGTPAWMDGELEAGRTFFAVVRYTFNSGTASDDSVSLYINPGPGENPPAVPDAEKIGNDLAQFDQFVLRQVSGMGIVEIDELRVGVSWESVTPFIPSPVFFAGGEPLPAGGEGRYGVIGTEAGSVCGTADVFGNGPYDLFAPLRTLYPFERFDENNTPVYGAPIAVSSPNLHGHAFQTANGDIFSLVYSGSTVYLRKFNRATRAFSAFSEYTMPGSGSNIAGFIADDGKVHIFYTVSDGTPYDPSPGSHDIDYRPFSGSGFWRGGLGYSHLYYARFSNTALAALEVHQRVGTGSEGYDYLFGCPGQTIANYGSGALKQVLLGANKLGIFRKFHAGAGPGGVPVDGVAFAAGDAEEPVALRHPVVNPRPAVIRNPVSGLSDLIVSDSSRYWHYPLKRVLDGGVPAYGERRPLLHASGKIICGALPVISPGDIDGDGRVDFIIGNDAGELMFMRNIGTAGAPKFSNPVEILAGGKPFRERAGYEGSIQGPGEASWGYSCPTLFDWNGNGKLDIIMNTIRGNLMVLLQIDGTANPPRFTEPLPLFCDSLDLHLSWRTQPGVTTWGGTTPPCIIANDENNEFRRFYRLDNQNVVRGEVLRLANGSAIRAHDSRYGGQWGRSKIVPADWDGDGRIDLIVGTGRAQSVPGPGGLPDNLTGDDRQAAVLFLRNIGSNQSPEFEWPVRLHYKGVPIRLGTHSCSPAPVHFGTGALDLIVGEERGTLMYYNHDDLGTVAY